MIYYVLKSLNALVVQDQTLVEQITAADCSSEQRAAQQQIIIELKNEIEVYLTELKGASDNAIAFLEGTPANEQICDALTAKLPGTTEQTASRYLIENEGPSWQKEESLEALLAAEAEVGFSEKSTEFIDRIRAHRESLVAQIERYPHQIIEMFQQRQTEASSTPPKWAADFLEFRAAPTTTPAEHLFSVCYREYFNLLITYIPMIGEHYKTTILNIDNVAKRLIQTCSLNYVQAGLQRLQDPVKPSSLETEVKEG